MKFDSKLLEQLKIYLGKLQNPLILNANLDESEFSIEMREFLEAVSDLSDKLSTNYSNNKAIRNPSFSVDPEDGYSGVSFASIPLGHEFSSFVLALLQVSGLPAKVEPATIETIKKIEDKLIFETYVSLGCQNCPDVVQALNLMSILNDNISHQMIDGSKFQREIDEKNILSVPTVYLNGEVFGQGRMDIYNILKKLNVEDNKNESFEKLGILDTIIIGGGPAGISSSIYLARKGLKIAIITDRFGGQVLDTGHIENFISQRELVGLKLVNFLKEHVGEYKIDLVNNSRVVNILKKDDKFTLELDTGHQILCRSIIVSTGAKWKNLDIEGEENFKNKGIAYCPHCDSPLFKDKDVAVIGGGNSGVEAAIDLSGICKSVTLIEYSGKLQADKVLIEKLNSTSNTSIITNAKTTTFYGGKKLEGLSYMNMENNEVVNVKIQGAFIQIGLIPNTKWLNGILELNENQEIVVNERCATSLEGIFAAGDCTSVPYKQIIVSMGEGAKAALSAFNYLI